MPTTTLEPRLDHSLARIEELAASIAERSPRLGNALANLGDVVRQLAEQQARATRPALEPVEGRLTLVRDDKVGGR